MRVVVTGAAQGLGAALAARFQRSRHSVLGLDRDWFDELSGKDLRGDRADGLDCHQTDLADEGAIAEAVDKIQETGPLDVLIHNAGINATGPFEQLDVLTMQNILAINLRAPILMTSALLKRNLISEGGVLVFVGSLSSYLSYPGAAVYAASKDGLLAYARSLTPSLARRRVACLCVLPGPMRTEHARIHAPAGADERGRLDPLLASDEVYRAVQRKRETLVPGWRAKILSGIGIAAPGLAERMMRKVIFVPLQAASRRAGEQASTPTGS